MAGQERRYSFKTLLSFDNHSNKTSGGKSIPNKKFNKSKEIFKAIETNWREPETYSPAVNMLIHNVPKRRT